MGILEGLMGSNTLYYPGCLTKFVFRDIEENYKKILRGIGIDYIMLRDFEVCCGSPAYSFGYDEDSKDIAKKNFETFKKHNVSRIITSCPTCYAVFTEDYPKLVGGWNIKAEHITQTVNNAIKRGHSFKKHEGLRVTYHDPCHLGRRMGEYDAPREILKSIGCEIIEMEKSKKNSLCCGGGGGVPSNFEELAKAEAEERIGEAKETGAEVLVTACSMCYAMLKERKKMKVMELSQLLV